MEALKNTSVQRAPAGPPTLPSLAGLPVVVQVMVKNLERSTPHERLGDRDRLATYVETFTQKDISPSDGAALNAHLAHYGLSPVTPPVSAHQAAFQRLLADHAKVKGVYSSHTGRDEPFSSEHAGKRQRFLSDVANTVQSMGKTLTAAELADAARILELGLRNLR
jgi:hypothetical protein